MVPSLIFTGGEPTLVSYLPELIKYSSSKPLCVGLMTNGSCLDERSARKLVDAGLKHVNISLDGAEAKTHDRFRGRRGSFARAVDSIRLFKDMGIKVETTSVIHSESEGEIDDIIRLGKSLGLDNMKFTPIVPFERGRQCDYSGSFRVYKRNIGKMMAYLAGDEAQNEVQINPNVDNPLRCNAGLGVVAISSNGDIYPCNNFETIVLGNLTRTPLHEILLDSSHISTVRELISIKGSECEYCPKLAKCRGGCAMLAFSYSESYNTCDPIRRLYIDELGKCD